MLDTVSNVPTLLLLACTLVAACGDDSGQLNATTEDSTDTDTLGTTSSPTPDTTTSSTPDTTTSSTPDTTTTSQSTTGSTSEGSTGETGTVTSDSDGSTGTSTTGDGTDTQGDTEPGTSTGEQPSVLSIDRIGRYAPEPLADLFDEGAAEISAYDPVSQSLLVTNGQTHAIDVLDLSDPTTPTLVQSITFADPDLSAPTSVSVNNGVVAAAVPNANDTEPGQVIFFEVDGTELASVVVGVLPDMVTFTPDGQRVLVANEGEPSGYEAGDIDPEGSVSIIDVSAGVANVDQADVSTAGFGNLSAGDLDATTRVFGPGSTIAQDLEPEYVAVSPDSSTAWVSLQENNALALVDIATATVTGVVGAGLVDHSLTGIDASDDDGVINIATWPVHGMRQPDSLIAFEDGGSTWIVSANEGDARDYSGLEEESRISDLSLDPTVFPNAADLQLDVNLGRLQATTENGDIDGDGEYDELWSFGSRSVTVFDASGAVVWDSGDAIEQAVAATFPADFNCDNDENGTFDGRSDNKGPEPEGLAVGEAFGTRYLFVGLERFGGFMVWEFDDPAAPVEWGIVNLRDFAGDPEMGTADDLAPEGLVFISANDSPTGSPLLVVTNEVSGTVSIYELTLVPA